jgi:hypothetical protein
MDITLRYHFIIFIILLCCCVVDVNAAATKIYQVPKSVDLSNAANASVFLDVVYETTANQSGNEVTRYTKRSTALSKASLGSMAKGALFGPLGLGITAALIAADYYFDDNGDLVYDSANTSQSIPANADLYCSQYNCSSSHYQDCLNWSGASYCYTTGNDYPNGDVIYYVSSTPVCSTGTLDPSTGYCLTTSTELATNDQIGDVIFSDPDLVSDLVNDSVSSGRWPNEWPEAQTLVDSINETLAESLEGVTASNPDPTVVTSSTTAPPPSDINIEFPVFCEWAGTVCDIYEWLTDTPELPADVPVPEKEITLENYSSGITAGSCPAPEIVNIGFMSQPIEIKWDYTCQLATTINPVVNAFSWLAALFIVIRVK